MSLGYEIWGDGPSTLVALHGFTGSRGAWRHLAPHWSGACRVLAVDLPGHGDSAAQAQLGFEDAVAQIGALVDRLGFRQAALVGYSLGARVALGLALQEPARWSRLVLESGSPGLRRRKARLERRRDDEALASTLQRDGVASFVQRWEALPLFDGLRKLPAPLREGLRERRLAGSPEGLAGSLRNLGVGSQPNYWPALNRLALPTLLITGGLDVKFTEIAKAMAAELPMAWRKTFPDAGHAPHLEIASDYAREVLAFLSTPWMDAPAMGPDAEEHA